MGQEPPWSAADPREMLCHGSKAQEECGARRQGISRSCSRPAEEAEAPDEDAAAAEEDLALGDGLEALIIGRGFEGRSTDPVEQHCAQ